MMKHTPEQMRLASNGTSYKVHERWEIPCRMARDHEGGIVVEVKKHLNGSGPNAFGGAQEWPHVELNAPFPEERRDLAVAFAEYIAAAAEKFLEENA